jgi:rare lipoprotein A
MTKGLRHSVFVIFILCCAGLSSCSSSKAPSPTTRARIVETQHGIASLYTDRRTASGERFSAGAFTAAHRHWPFGCLVRCTNLHNGRWVVVRVNDRGPFVRGRVIDLTPKAAAVIGLTRSNGLCQVRIERFQ